MRKKKRNRASVAAIVSMYVCNIHKVSKYNLLCLYNVICMYRYFRADHSALNNQIVCSSLEKTTSPFHSFLQLPSGRLRAQGLSHFCTTVVVVQIMLRPSHWWDFMGLDSQFTWREKSHSNLPDPLPIFWLLQRSQHEVPT